MILNDAIDIKLGTVDVNAVYLGADLIWQRSTPSGTVLTSTDFIQGSIRGSTGGWMDSSTRIMCTTYFPTDGATTMTVEIHPDEQTKTMKWCVQGYYGYGHLSNSDYESPWISGTEYDLTELPADTEEIRIVVAFSNNANIIPSDLSRFIFTLS